MTLEELNELGFTIELQTSNIEAVETGFNYGNISLEQIMDNPDEYIADHKEFYYDNSTRRFNLTDLDGYVPLIENCTYEDIIEYVKNLG